MRTGVTDCIKARIEESTPASPPGAPRKKLSRGKVLALAGIGTLVLVAGCGIWRVTTQRLLDAQQRAWESGNHRKILIAAALVRSLINTVAGHSHIDRGRRGETVTMEDGERLTIFRQMHLDVPGAPAPSGEFRVRFHTRMPLRPNEWFSLLTIPLFSGLPGFRDKTWLVNEATGFSAAVYHWQAVEDAARYARSPALAFMTRRSLPGTISHRVGLASNTLTGPWPPDSKEEPSRRHKEPEP